MTVELKTEIWPIDKVIPFPGNPRKISEAAVNMVARSLRKFEWRQPIVVDKAGVIVVGHVRYLAARKLGMDFVPVHIAENLTPAQIRAYRLMDNRSHEETDWDTDLLTLEMVELKALDFGLLDFTGFTPRQIDELLVGPEAGADQADVCPPPPSDPVTALGDLWQCGEHRVLCGDATSPDAVERLLGEASPQLMVTDPPYGVEYDPEWREQAGLGKQRQVGKVLNDDRVDWTAAYQLFRGDVAYIWHAGLHSAEVAMGLQSVGLEVRSQIIWAKPHFALSRGLYHWQHEPCWMCVRKGRGAHWRGDRTQSTLWQVASLNPFGGNNPEETATGHGTQKPVELMRRPILNHTERGEVIYDPFLGSGTSLVAAALTGRICYGLDIDPKYVDVIVGRWQQLTGKAATLEGDGRSFDEIQAVRSMRVIEKR
jgi:DNA modification methylase